MRWQLTAFVSFVVFVTAVLAQEVADESPRVSIRITAEGEIIVDGKQTKS